MKLYILGLAGVVFANGALAQNDYQKRPHVSIFYHYETVVNPSNGTVTFLCNNATYAFDTSSEHDVFAPIFDYQTRDRDTNYQTESESLSNMYRWAKRTLDKSVKGEIDPDTLYNTQGAIFAYYKHHHGAVAYVIDRPTVVERTTNVVDDEDDRGEAKNPNVESCKMSTQRLHEMMDEAQTMIDARLGFHISLDFKDVKYVGGAYLTPETAPAQPVNFECDTAIDGQRIFYKEQAPTRYRYGTQHVMYRVDQEPVKEREETVRFTDTITEKATIDDFDLLKRYDYVLLDSSNILDGHNSSEGLIVDYKLIPESSEVDPFFGRGTTKRGTKEWNETHFNLNQLQVMAKFYRQMLEVERLRHVR